MTETTAIPGGSESTTHRESGSAADYNIDKLVFAPERTAKRRGDEYPVTNAERRVFLAEDDFEMRQLLSEALTAQGYSVTEARNGRELYAALQPEIDDGRPPALVVSDIRMPGTTGIDVLRRVRKLGCDVPFILITAFGDDDTVNEAARLEVPLLFRKPFDIEDFLTVVAFLT
jgi:DNA-binding NtrC family response regulator